MEKVFAYGTLRRKERNHDVMLAHGATFVKEAFIKGRKFQNRYGLPAVIPGNDEVSGEVYDVSTEGLSGLDRFEGHPSFYERRETTTTEGEKVWVYFFNEPFLLPPVSQSLTPPAEVMGDFEAAA